MNTPPRITANKAAAEIRHKILRKMDELIAQDSSFEIKWEELIRYISGMARRASAKKGGLGSR
jgi:hypothetical protein